MTTKEITDFLQWLEGDAFGGSVEFTMKSVIAARYQKFLSDKNKKKPQKQENRITLGASVADEDLPF